jgi:cytochrome c556
MSVGRGIERAQTVVGRADTTAALALSWALFGWAISGGTLSGCAPAPSVPRPASTTAPAPGGTGASGSSARESLADNERQVAERTDAQGRKWLGDVPYDVFFDDPLTVAAEGRAKSAPSTAQPNGKAAVASAEHSVGSSATPGVTTAGETSTHPANRTGTTSATSAGTSTAKTAAPSTDWSDLIDPDTLDAEVKRIRTELTAGLQSVGKYSARYQEIAVAGATLAALAEIVIELPRSSSWKEHAANVRDLAASIHDAAKALGGPAYQATKAPTDQLMDVLDGNLPAGLPAAEPMRDFSQVANRSALMKRMDRSFQRLKKGGTAQQLLKNNAAQALEDAAMLAVLSRVISVGHYDSADDPKYHAHATELTRGATDLATAAKSGEAPAFADALTRIQKRCDACHADFRF